MLVRRLSDEDRLAALALRKAKNLDLGTIARSSAAVSHSPTDDKPPVFSSSAPGVSHICNLCLILAFPSRCRPVFASSSSSLFGYRDCDCDGLFPTTLLPTVVSPHLFS